MADTINSLLADLRLRLHEPTEVVWSDDSLKSHIRSALEGLYPTFYQFAVATTTASDGPLQTQPATARNIYSVGLQRTGTSRVRPLRHWVQGTVGGSAFIPKTGISGQTLVWGWTHGWTAPTDDDDDIDLIPEAKELLLIRAHIAAMEELLTMRTSKNDAYLSLSVREQVTEEEIVGTLEALHASARERADRAMPLPEVQR